MKQPRTYKTWLVNALQSFHAVGTRSAFNRGLAVITLIAFCNWSAHAAAPPAGASIGNQASATYTDASNAPRTATSNPVVTIVQQVYALDLTADGSKIAAIGAQVAFPHTLVNNGNGNDSFTLSAVNGGGAFTFSGVAIYADGNGDGIPDNAINITATPSIAAGESFQFVIVGSVPGTATAGTSSTLSVTATSQGDGGQTDSNTDTVTVTADAAINVTKSISSNSGSSPSGPYTYTITYQNTGNNTATNLVISDLIPAGMTYVDDSGRASLTGNTVLTDDDDADSQGTNPNTIIYDFDVTTPNRVTAKIANILPGQSGTVTFQVTVNAGVAPGQIVNTANYEYYDGSNDVGPFISNPAIFNVLQTASVTLGDDSIATATQGSTITFTNLLTNTGNGTDSFDITVQSSTFPVGTTVTFYNTGGSPMTDSGGSSAPDTGPIAAGATYNVLVQVTLPPTATAAPYELVLRATSTFNNTVFDPGTDTLGAITANSVDLANDAPNGPGLGNTGVSSGNGLPEIAAVTTKSANPGTTTRFVLYVNNLSGVADSYDMSASTDSTFGSVTLPAGWSVVFRDASEAVIANTGIILPSGNKLVNADVTVPIGQAPGTTSIYFRSRSPVTLASDRKHDALTVNTVRSLQLTPNNSGQVFPGGSVVYNHVLVNQGNVAEGDGVLSTIALTAANSESGFSVVIYRDANANAVLDAADVIVSNLNGIGLAPGASVNLFVKVFAPAGANAGSIDVATLTATTSNGTYITAVPPVASSTDTSTVISGDLTIEKEQALDANSNGVLDGGEVYTTGNITTGALPGASIIYRLRVTNTGTADATAVVVTDTTPTFTTYSNYSGAAPAATSKGSISAPGNGSTGTVTADIGTMAPGEIVTITFGVIINQ